MRSRTRATRGKPALSTEGDPAGGLHGYQVLDLAEGGADFCARILADLGARVTKIEKPGGSASRDLGPFLHGDPSQEKSLFWLAYNCNKKGITLNLETKDGQALFRRLVERADFVIESFRPGYLAALGLDYASLSRINPRLIMTSISPYGQTGPKAGYDTTELTSWASCGLLYTVGDPDRAPTFLAFPASVRAGAEAAVATLIAHWHREGTGEGQQVDVSIQECGIALLQAMVEAWDVSRHIYARAGQWLLIETGVPRRMIFPCRDGFVAFSVFGGAPGLAASTRAVVEWMEEEGMAPPWLTKFDWLADYDASRLTEEEAERLDKPFYDFFLTKTRAQLFHRALEKGIILAPVNTVADVRSDAQLAAREFWLTQAHHYLGESLTYCGPFAKLSVTPITFRRHAPLLGEHNQEVYGELRLSESEMASLKAAGVI